MNKKTKKAIIGLAAGIVIGCILIIGAIVINDKINTNNVATKVQNNVDVEVRECFQHIVIEDMKAVISSNPYDCINTSYYNKLVDLGVEAVPIIEDMYYSGEIDGAIAYIAGVALEEIVQCNLGQLSGMQIKNEKEFFVAWRDIADDFTANIKSIMSDNTTDEIGKFQRIQLYGVLGESFLYNVAKCEDTTITYVGEEYECGDLAKKMNSAGYIVKITKEEDEFIRKYLEAR